MADWCYFPRVPVFSLGNRFKNRSRVPVDTLIGFFPTEPTRLGVCLPPLDGEEIQSGMLIVVATGFYNGVTASGFRIAQAADGVSGSSFYVAFHDYDSHDVRASGNLVGIPCRQRAELLSGYFEIDPGDFFLIGAPLTAGDGGVFVPADTPDERVVAHISAAGSLDNGAFPFVGTAPSVHVDDTAVIQVILGQTGLVTNQYLELIRDEGESPFLDEDDIVFLP